MKPKVTRIRGVWHIQCRYAEWPFSSHAEAVLNLPRIIAHEAEITQRIEDAKAKRRKKDAFAATHNAARDKDRCVYGICRQARQREISGVGGFCTKHYELAQHALANPTGLSDLKRASLTLRKAS